MQTPEGSFYFKCRHVLHWHLNCFLTIWQIQLTLWLWPSSCIFCPSQRHWLEEKIPQKCSIPWCQSHHLQVFRNTLTSSWNFQDPWGSVPHAGVTKIMHTGSIIMNTTVTRKDVGAGCWHQMLLVAHPADERLSRWQWIRPNNGLGIFCSWH